MLLVVAMLPQRATVDGDGNIVAKLRLCWLCVLLAMCKPIGHVPAKTSRFSQETCISNYRAAIHVLHLHLANPAPHMLWAISIAPCTLVIAKQCSQHASVHFHDICTANMFATSNIAPVADLGHTAKWRGKQCVPCLQHKPHLTSTVAASEPA